MSESVLKVTQMNHFSNVITSVKLRQNKISHVIVSRAGLSHCSVTIFLLGCVCACVRVFSSELHVTVLPGCAYVSVHDFYLSKSKWRFKWRGASLKSVKFVFKIPRFNSIHLLPTETHLSHTCAKTTHLRPHRRVETAETASSICNAGQPHWLPGACMIYARMVAGISSLSPGALCIWH